MKPLYLGFFLLLSMVSRSQSANFDAHFFLGGAVESNSYQAANYHSNLASSLAVTLRTGVYSYHRLLLAARFDYYQSNFNTEDYQNIRGGILARVYFLDHQIRPYLEASLSYDYLVFQFGEEILSEEEFANTLKYGPAVGVAYFITPQVNVDLALQLNAMELESGTFPPPSKVNYSVGLGAGLNFIIK